MGKHIWAYKLTKLPDPAYPSYRLKAGGDVRAAIQAGSEHLPRTLADFPANSAAVAIRFVYSPAAEAQDPQERLVLYLLGRARQKEMDFAVNLLLERGPFSRFYELESVKGAAVDWSDYCCACDVVRRQNIFTPTVTTEFNVKALPGYYSICPFEAKDDNDYLLLDSILDRLGEGIIVDICLEPVDVSQELLEHTRYLSRLQQVNRSWDSDDDEPFDGDWGAAAEQDWRNISRNKLRPLRQRDPLVDNILRQQQRFHETFAQPHLRFHIRVFAKTPAVARLLGSVIAESAFKDGNYQLFESRSGDSVYKKATDGCKQLDVVSASALVPRLKELDIDDYEALAGLSNLATVDQLTGVFRLPVASYGSPCCIRKNTDPPHEKADGMILLGYDEQSAGSPVADGNGAVPRGIRLDRLVKHAFVGGMPGSGKTTAMINILDQLANRDIPFIVFEPAKSEYRLLKCLKKHKDPQIRRLSKQLQLYTPGNEKISPFRLNPLRLLPGISLNEHIENLITCFKASMPMLPVFPAILGEALEQIYSQNPDPDKPPTMRQLQVAAENVLNSKDYSGEIRSNLRAALEVRLGLLTRRAIGSVFQGGGDTPSIDQLINGFSIVELGSLPTEQACLLTLFILMMVRERVKMITRSDRDVQLAIVLEEAHNIVGPAGKAAQSEEQADPKAFAAEFICLMLAELRALGVAIIIVDQLPSTVAPEVIKNTASKLAFRQVANEDRAELGGTMLFGQIETEEIARLQPGEAYFFTEGYFGTRRIRTPNLHEKLKLPSPPIGEAIVPYISDDDWFKDASDNRLFSMFKEVKEQMEKLEAKLLAIGVETKEILNIVVEPADMSVKQHATQAGCARKYHARVCSAYNEFIREIYRPALQETARVGIHSESLQKCYDSLIHVFDSVIQVYARGLLKSLNGAIRWFKASAKKMKGT